MHGVSPSALRKGCGNLKTFPPLFFHLTLKGGIEMNYRIVERGAFYLMGKTGRIPMIYHGSNPHTAEVWRKLTQADLLVLMEHSRVDPKGIVCAYSSSENGIPVAEGEVVPMYVGVVMEEPMPARFKGRFDVVPYEASTWLVFSAMDNTKDSSLTSFPHIYAQISEWLPISEYEHTSSLALTWHESYDISKPDRKSEVWVPVRRRG
jgi:AraC family transcriptional regulator